MLVRGIRPVVRVRSGLARFAKVLRSGAVATIVAFGTSITLIGAYLETVVPELQERTGNSRVQLVNRGLRGFSTMLGAFRTAGDVVPAAPGLLLIEFSHNDLTPTALDMIEPAVHGIVSRVRAASPECDFAFVYLAPPGLAAAGPTPAMERYERVADHFGFPSFDLATPTEALVRAGGATWTGTPDALTFDGVHHSRRAVEVIGRPFGTALADVLLASSGPPGPPVAALPSMFEFVERRAAEAFIAGGNWAVGEPVGQENRQADAYTDTVAQAASPESALRVAFTGRWLAAWVNAATELQIALEGREATAIAVHSAGNWVLVALTPMLPPGDHSVVVSRGPGPAAFGDVFVVGAFA